MVDTIISKNLLKGDSAIYDAIRYTNTNSTVKTMADIGAQELSLGVGTGTDGFLIYSNASGEVGITTPLFNVTASESYKITGMFTVGTFLAGKTIKIKVEYFDVSSGGVSSALS